MSKFENRVSRKALNKCIAKRLKNSELHELVETKSAKEVEQLVDVVTS